MEQLEQAIALVKKGDNEQAREILKDILREDQNNETAWLYMITCAKTKGEFRRCVREVLRINPENETALKLAKKHDIDIPEASISDAEFYAEDVTLQASTTDILPHVVPMDTPSQQEIESELEVILPEEDLFEDELSGNLTDKEVLDLYDETNGEFDGELIVHDDMGFGDNVLVAPDLSSDDETQGTISGQTPDAIQVDDIADLDDLLTDTVDRQSPTSSEPKRKRSLMALVLLIIFLAIIAGSITLLFLSSTRQDDDQATRTVEASNIEATNLALENSVVQTATAIQETVSAPTITPTIDLPATEQAIVDAEIAQTQAVEATQLAITPTLTPREVENGLLVAVQHENDNADIIVFSDLTDTNPINLTNDPAVDEMPRWSPDGQWLAFVSNRSGSKDIYIMRADGSELRQLTDATAEDLYPSWSPDGRQLVFSSNRDGDFDLFVITVDSAEIAVKLTTNDAFDSFPHWSLDNRLVFASNRDGNFEIYKMDSDGQNLQRMTETSADEFYPVWSPSAQQIVFISQTADGREIYSIRQDGTGLVPLTDTQADEFSPNWSPDGNFIVFAAEEKGSTALYLIRPDGNDYSKVREDALPIDSPDWAIEVE